MEEGDKLHYLNTTLLSDKKKKTTFIIWLFKVSSAAVHSKLLSLASGYCEILWWSKLFQRSVKRLFIVLREHRNNFQNNNHLQYLSYLYPKHAKNNLLKGNYGLILKTI